MSYIFRYPGGKSKKSVREKILSRFPKKYSEYRDAMVGGGGIFFSICTNKKRWINDIDENLISVYKALRDEPKDFIKKCRTIKKEQPDDELVKSKPNGKAVYNARLKAEFDRLAKGEDCPLKYLFVNRTVWGGRVNYDMESRMYFSNPKGWNLVHTDKMEKAAQKMTGVKVTSGGYKVLLEEDGDDVLVYLDPPYFVNTNLEKSSRLYKHNFEINDHVDFCNNVKKCKHKILISYDDHPFIRNLYKDFNLGKADWTYCGTSSQTKKIGKELIITNY